MANIFDRFLNSMKLYDEDEEEEEELLEEPAAEEEEAPASKPSIFARKVQKEEPAEEPEEQPRPSKPAPAPRRSAAPVTPMRSNRQTNMEVCMVKPTSMEDARDICDILLSGRAVVINMEGVQVELAQRIIDFSSGACYSIDGNLQKISGFIFILTPSNIELSGDFQNVLGSSRSSNPFSGH